MALRRWITSFGRKPIHEATGRAWCRLVFVLAGALPVLITFIACCAERLPAYQRARVERYAHMLSQVTGISVQVDRVQLLTPTQRLLYGVKLSHPETGAPLGQIEGLWVSETPTGCAIHAQQSALTAEQLADCYHLIHEQVLCRPSSTPHALVLWMNDLIIQGQSDQPLVFSKVHMELKRQPKSTAGSLKFRLAAFPGQEALMTFDRQHDQTEPISHWTLNCGSQALPGAWINRFAGNYALPGTQSAFTGSFDLTYNQGFWNLSGAGHMQRVDASAWFERPLISGLAYVDITRFNLNDRGLKHVTGSLSIQDGRIHSHLLLAAKDIDVHIAGEPDQFEKRYQGGAVPFQAITAGFQLDSQGLQIMPLFEKRVVVKDAVGAIAQLGQYSLIPVVNLAVCLSKTAADENSRTTTASRLVQWLPNAASPAAVPANYQVSQ